MKKLLVVGVIVLFLGLAFAPSINASISKSFIDSELVEITTEVCGLKGGEHTVSLSKEDALEVEKLIDDIKRRLDKVETREDAVEIFNEAVVELDKYGLLGGLSVKQAQRLVAGRYQNSRMMKLLEKLNPSTSDKERNYLCLIAGKTDITIFEGRMFRLCSYIRSIFRRSFFGNLLDGINPITLRSRIGLGINQVLWNMSLNANGWVHTIGINGVKDWNGSIRGNLSTSLRVIYGYPGFTFGYFEVYYGVHGFRGIKVYLDRNFYYMGFASRVKISHAPPDV